MTQQIQQTQQTQQPLPRLTTSSAREQFLQNYVDNKGRGNPSLFAKDRKDRLETLTTSAVYDPISKTYNLNDFQKHVLGITDQDIFNAKRNAELETFKNQYGGKYQDLNLGERIKGGANFQTIINEINTEEEYRLQAPQLRQQLGQIGGGYGTAALQGLGEKPTLLEMNAALTTAQRAWEEDPTNETSPLNMLRDQKANQQKIDGERATELTRSNQLANRNIDLLESGQKFQETQAAEQARNRWEDNRQARREAALTREMNAENNAMQMQLEYSRLAQADATRAQDRKDKAIMALLGGLGNLGAAFTI